MKAKSFRLIKSSTFLANKAWDSDIGPRSTLSREASCEYELIAKLPPLQDTKSLFGMQESFSRWTALSFLPPCNCSSSKSLSHLRWYRGSFIMIEYWECCWKGKTRCRVRGTSPGQEVGASHIFHIERWSPLPLFRKSSQRAKEDLLYFVTRAYGRAMKFNSEHQSLIYRAKALDWSTNGFWSALSWSYVSNFISSSKMKKS